MTLNNEEILDQPGVTSTGGGGDLELLESGVESLVKLRSHGSQVLGISQIVFNSPVLYS